MADYGSGGVYRRGAIWWIRYSHHGRQIRESSRSRDRRAAQQLLRQRLHECDLGGFRPPGQRTVAEAFEALGRDLQLRQVRSWPNIRPFLRRMQARLGRWRVADCTAEVIEAALTPLHQAGYAPATINHHLRLTLQALRLAQQRGWLLRVPRVRPLPVANTRQGFVTHAAFLAIVAHLEPVLADLAWFAYRTGWRRGELFQLRWEDVDWAEGVVRPKPGTTKTGAPHLAPLVGDVEAVLRRRLTAAVRPGGVIPWVFHRHGRRLPSATFQRHWRAACQRAGQPQVLFHDLRRTAARNLILAGVPLRVAMDLTGHKTRSMFDRYHIVEVADLRQALTRVSHGAAAAEEAHEGAQDATHEQRHQ